MRFLLPAPFFIAFQIAISHGEDDCKYASRDRITTLFTALAKKDYPTFFAAVVDNVNWTIQGTHPLSGQYDNKTTFVINTIARLARIQSNTAPNNMDTFNIVGGCNEEWSSQEISSHQVMLNGEPASTGAMMWLTTACRLQVRRKLQLDDKVERARLHCAGTRLPGFILGG
ncbi:MAG: hypothetical protein Q9160_006618 [Pyrenula sp. 1 TL-2023]